MDPATRNTLRAAERAVTRLIDACEKDGPLYVESPRAVAQVSRTGKWLINAITALHRELNEPASDPAGQTD